MHTAYQANNARLLVTHRGAAVLPGQYSLLRRLAASCIVWSKAEPAIRTILHDVLNGQITIVVAHVDFVGQAQSARMTAGGLGHGTIRMRTTYK